MKSSFKRTLLDSCMDLFDKIDKILIPITGIFAGIGFCTCIVACVVLTVRYIQEQKLNMDGQNVTVSIRITEVADDGVLSHARKYYCKNIERAEPNYIRLKDAKDDFGHNYKRVIIQNVPYIIEQTVEAK